MATSVQKRKVVQKEAPGKEVAVRKGTAIVAGSWRDRAKQSVIAGRAQTMKLPAASGNFLSFQGGTISLGGNDLDNPLPIIILAHGFQRTYYRKQYKPGDIEMPDCYSYDGIAPHEKAPTPQSDKCRDCQFNEFGSAREGAGKGCKEGARLVLMHGDAIESVQSILTAQLVQAHLSVLNSKTFRSFAEAHNEALWQDLVKLKNVADKKSQYAVSFMDEGLVFEEEILDAIASRVDEAEKLMTQPYPDPIEKKKTSEAPVRKRKF